jgi:ABC-type enterochelin transport system substrate-binding protein
MYNPALLQAIGMDVRFTTIWKAIGWKEVDPLWEDGSHLLTIQILYSLQELENGITFRLFEIEYFCT